MHTIIYTKPAIVKSLLYKGSDSNAIQLIEVVQAVEFEKYPDASLYIDGAFDGTFASVSGPYLINSTDQCLTDFEKLPKQVGRFCGWPGFWERALWEIAVHKGSDKIFTDLLTKLGIQAKIVPDIPGFIAPRILCTIINEAFFTLWDSIATVEDIDTAMKLGTNYPYGPFEWSKNIGYQEIELLLAKMAKVDTRYALHPKFGTFPFTT